MYEYGLKDRRAVAKFTNNIDKQQNGDITQDQDDFLFDDDEEFFERFDSRG